MISLGSLQKVHDDAQAIMNLEALPPGTIQTDRWQSARRIKECAETAIRWLRAMGLTQREQVGPFGGKPIRAGDRVKIRKGTVIDTTHPRYDRQNPKIARRDYAVVVNRVVEGSLQTHWHDHRAASAARDQMVCWPGEGGYWCYVPTHEVDVL